MITALRAMARAYYENTNRQVTAVYLGPRAWAAFRVDVGRRMPGVLGSTVMFDGVRYEEGLVEGVVIR